MNQYRPSPFNLLPPVVKNLLIINGICFIALLTPHLGTWLMHFGSAHYIDSPHFRIWQLVTYAFLHSPTNMFHIFFNMFALFMFGGTLEQLLGSKRFLTYYLATAVGAIVLQEAVNCYQVYSLTGHIFPYSMKASVSNPLVFYQVQEIYNMETIGASGAVFGLLLAFGYLFPNAMLYIYFLFPIRAKYFVVIYGAIELYMALNNNPGDNIAHFAHLGGMLFGFLLLKYWNIRRPDSYY